MKRTTGILAAVALILAMLSISPGDLLKSKTTIITENYIRQAEAEQALAQAQADHERNRQLVETAFFSLFGLLTVWGLLLAYNYHQDKTTQRLVRLTESDRLLPSPEGLYPLPDLRLLPAEIRTQAGLLLYAGQMQASINHNTPHMIRAEHKEEQKLLAAPTETVESSLPTAPRWSEIIQTWKPSIDNMLLGYSSTGPQYGSIDALLSTAIAGRPGTGKSTALRFIYAQTVMAGGQVAIFDPHGSIIEDTPGAPVALHASNARELNDAADWLISELEQRLEAHKAGKRDHTPLLVLCDEWPIIALQSQRAVGAAGRLILEGRKLRMYGLISGQGLPAGQLGGSLVRDALSSRYVFKTTAQQARMAGLDKETAKMLDTLDIGRAVFAGPTDPQIVAIPQTTALDLATLSTRNGSQTPAERATYPQHDEMRSSPSQRLSNNIGELLENAKFDETPRNALQSPSNEIGELLESDEHARIRDIARRLRDAGIPKTKAVQALWGVSAGGSERYRRYAALYEEMAEKV